MVSDPGVRSYKLEDCPICHEHTKLGYACGDFFVICSNGCEAPMCDHPTKSMTIIAWNNWVASTKLSWAPKWINTLRAKWSAKRILRMTRKKNRMVGF